MTCTRPGMTAAVAAMIVGVGALVSAQVPSVAARHVRSAPLRVARLTSAPLTNAVGSFSALRSNSRSVSVFGIVQNHVGALVPNAGRVILRELLTGQVAGTADVNDLAQFSLRTVPPGLYSAELLEPTGRVIASTPAFAAAAGQVIQLAQTIPSLPAQGLARVAASATSNALVSAASSGVLAVAPGASVTPGR